MLNTIGRCRPLATERRTVFPAVRHAPVRPATAYRAASPPQGVRLVNTRSAVDLRPATLAECAFHRKRKADSRRTSGSSSWPRCRPHRPPCLERTRVDALREALATRVVVADGAMGTMLQAQDPTPRRLPAARGLQRDPERHPPGHRPLGPRGVLRGRRRLRRDQHLRRELRGPRRVRHPRADLRALRGRRPHRPRGRRRVHRATGQQRWVLGSMGPGTKLPTLGHAPYADAARRLPAERRGHDRRRRRRAAGRDHPGPAADQGRDPRRPPRPGRHRREPAAHLLRSPSRPPARCCSARRSAPR